MKAYCFVDGAVGFARDIPVGALPIASGPKKVLENEMIVLCRLAYDGETLLVPGVPEANDQIAGVDALLRFKDRLRKRGIVKV